VPHYTEQLAGSDTATQALLSAQGSSIQAVPSNARRLAVTLQAGGGPIALGYGATASFTGHMTLASGAVMEELQYKGQINAVVATGASAPLFILDVYRNP